MKLRKMVENEERSERIVRIRKGPKDAEAFSQSATAGVPSDGHYWKNAEKMAKLEKERTVATEYASLKNFKDPVEVTEESSKFVMNLIGHHCKSGTAHALKVEYMNAIIKGLCIVYN